MSEFVFEPAECIPFRDKKVIEKCRAIKKEDIEKHPNPDLKIKVVKDGGADICYSGPSWTGHLAFIEPDAPELQAPLDRPAYNRCRKCCANGNDRCKKHAMVA